MKRVPKDIEEEPGPHQELFNELGKCLANLVADVLSHHEEVPLNEDLKRLEHDKPY